MVDVTSVHLCDVCKEANRISVLQLYQINFTEALLLCPEEQCTFPLGKKTTYPTTVKRHANDIPRNKRRSSRASSCLSSPALPPSGVSTPDYGLLWSPGLQPSGVGQQHHQQFASKSLNLPDSLVQSHDVSADRASFVHPGDVTKSTSCATSMAQSLYNIPYSDYSSQSISASTQNGHTPLISVANLSTSTITPRSHVTFAPSLTQPVPLMGQATLAFDLSTTSSNGQSGFVHPASHGTSMTWMTPDGNNAANDSFDALDLDLDLDLLSNLEIPAQGEEARSIMDSLSELLNSTETVSNGTDSPSDAMLEESAGAPNCDSSSQHDHSYANISQVEIDPSPPTPNITDNLCSVQHVKLANACDKGRVDFMMTGSSSHANREVTNTHPGSNEHYKDNRTYFTDIHRQPNAKVTPATVNVTSVKVKTDPDNRFSVMGPAAILYPQWTNRDSLCWLDVVMSMLVHCYSLHQVAQSLVETTIVRTLCNVYQEACRLLGNHHYGSKRLNLETSIGTVCVKTGGGDCQIPAPVLNGVSEKLRLFDDSGLMDELMGDLGGDLGGKSVLMSTPTKYDPIKHGEAIVTACSGLFKESPDRRSYLKDSPVRNTSDVPNLLSHLDEGSLRKASMLLNDIRERIWASIQPRMRSRRGAHDSPLFALPLILEQEPSVEDLFTVGYTWKMVCCHCGYQHEDRVSRTVPTFPNVPADFSMMAPCFIRSCFKCEAPQQRMNMVFNRLPPVLVIHFVNGLSSSPLSSYDFKYRGATYHVTAVIQYCTSPNHFVTWLRNPHGNCWMECDDLKSSVCRYDDKVPSFPPDQVHLMMWERHGDIVPVPTTPAASMKSEMLPPGFNSTPIMHSSPIAGSIQKFPVISSVATFTPLSTPKQCVNTTPSSLPKFQLSQPVKSASGNLQSGASRMVSLGLKNEKVLPVDNLHRLTNILTSNKNNKTSEHFADSFDAVTSKSQKSRTPGSFDNMLETKTTGTFKSCAISEKLHAGSDPPVSDKTWSMNFTQKALRAQAKLLEQTREKSVNSQKSLANSQVKIGSDPSGLRNRFRIFNKVNANPDGDWASKALLKMRNDSYNMPAKNALATRVKPDMQIRQNTRSTTGDAAMSERITRMKMNVQMLRERQTAGKTGAVSSYSMPKSNAALVKSSQPPISEKLLYGMGRLKTAAPSVGTQGLITGLYSSLASLKKFEGYQFGKKSVEPEVKREVIPSETSNLTSSPQKVVRFIDVKRGIKRTVAAGTEPSPPAKKKFAVDESNLSGAKRRIVFPSTPSSLALRSPTITQKLLSASRTPQLKGYGANR